MEIIPKEHNKVVYIENEQNLALCAYLKNDQEVDNTYAFNATKKENLFDAYVLFDLNSNEIIDKHNVVVEEFPTIGYVRISNLHDENGEDLELCHYINNDASVVPPSSWWKSHFKPQIRNL